MKSSVSRRGMHSSVKKSNCAKPGLSWKELLKAAGVCIVLKPQVAKTGQKTVGWRYHRGHGLKIRGHPVSTFLNVNVVKSGEWADAVKDAWVKRMVPLDDVFLGKNIATLK